MEWSRERVVAKRLSVITSGRSVSELSLAVQPRRLAPFRAMRPRFKNLPLFILG
jgi:hypothetical protein